MEVSRFFPFSPLTGVTDLIWLLFFRYVETTNYCWWFRILNNHLGCIKPWEIMGRIYQPQRARFILFHSSCLEWYVKLGKRFKLQDKSKSCVAKFGEIWTQGALLWPGGFKGSQLLGRGWSWYHVVSIYGVFVAPSSKPDSLWRESQASFPLHKGLKKKYVCVWLLHVFCLDTISCGWPMSMPIRPRIYVQTACVIDM